MIYQYEEIGMETKIRKILLMLMILFPLSVFAGVNLKNGNFYISYTDIVVPGGGDRLEVTRTYNSKSIKKGWFGYGWGSDYETFLVVAADGSVIVHENGTGAETRFVPKTAVNAEAAAAKIVEAMAKKTGLAGDQAEKLKEKLKNDAELRQSYGMKFGVEGQIAKGTILYSNDRGLQQMHRTEEGFERRYNDGKVEYFSLK
jgi:hypothetical protein